MYFSIDIFAPTGRGEAFSSHCSSLGKLIQEKVGSKNFTLIDNETPAMHVIDVI